MLERRDCSLLGKEGRKAVEKGLAAAEWCHTELPHSEMKELMHRTDRHALRDTAFWLATLAFFAGAGIHFWPSWLFAPFWLAYGVLCGSSSVSRWHGTAFRTALPVLMRLMRGEDVFTVRKPPDPARPLRANLA